MVKPSSYDFIEMVYSKGRGRDVTPSATAEVTLVSNLGCPHVRGIPAVCHLVITGGVMGDLESPPGASFVSLVCRRMES